MSKTLSAGDLVKYDVGKVTMYGGTTDFTAKSGIMILLWVPDDSSGSNIAMAFKDGAPIRVDLRHLKRVETKVST